MDSEYIYFSMLLIFNLFYILTTVSSFSSLPVPSPQLFSASPNPLFRKGKDDHGRQQNMAYQLSPGQALSPCIKAEWNIPL